MGKDDWAWQLVRAKHCRWCDRTPDNYLAHLQAAHRIQWSNYLHSRSVSSDIQLSKLPVRIKRLFGITFD